jgi:hypothetical protein
VEFDDRQIALHDQVLHVQLSTSCQNLSEFGESAFSESFLAEIVTGKRMSTHHHSVDIVGYVLKEGRAIALFKPLEDFENALICQWHCCLLLLQFQL